MGPWAAQMQEPPVAADKIRSNQKSRRHHRPSDEQQQQQQPGTDSTSCPLMRSCVRTASSLLHGWRTPSASASVRGNGFPLTSRLLERLPPLTRCYAQAFRPQGELEKRIAQIPIDRYRNFCIVAHVDHGKSTLSDRLLEITGTIQPGGQKQFLDKLDVERERGITVKAQTCSMIYTHEGEDYLLHLVDTPGHVDFRAEVSRSYASCGGALLLVDASQGVQAQTVANFYLAFAQGLTLVPVLNKVDLPHADPPRVLEQMRTELLLLMKLGFASFGTPTGQPSLARLARPR